MSDHQILHRYLRAVLAHRWLLLTPGVVLFVAAAVWTAAQTDVYEAQAVLMSQLVRPAGGLFKQAVTAGEKDVYSGTKERLFAFDLVSRVIRDHGIYKETIRKKGMEGAVERFRENLRVAHVRDSSSVGVSFRYSGADRPAETAADVVNDLVDLFVVQQRNAMSQKAVEMKSFVQTRLDQLNQELKDAELKLEAFRKEHVGELPEDRTNNEAKIAQSQRRIELCLERQQRNREEIERQTVASFELKRKLEQPGVMDNGDWLTRVIKQHLGDLKTLLAQERTIFHEDSERIRKRLEQVAETQKRLDEAEEKSGGGTSETKIFYQWLLDTNASRQAELHKEIETCERSIEEEKQAIAAITKRIDTAADLEAQYTALRRAVDDAQGRRMSMFVKQEAVGFTVDFQDHDPSVPLEVEQRAFASSVPTGPHRVVNVVVGLLLGLVLGAMLVFARVRLDHGFHRGDELRLLLPGAVLVTLPEVSGVRQRVGAVFGNFFVGLVLTGLFLSGVAVLGLQMGWWGEPEMLAPLLRLGAG